jgi:dihydrofolate reductase
MAGREKIIIVAMTAERVIGRGGTIPWHIGEELALFRRLTMGHSLIMGRRTFQSIGRPLPGRLNIVVSRTLPPSAGLVVCSDLAGALRRAQHEERTIFFIGGREIYRQALPLADGLSVSWIKRNYAGDCLFPEYDESRWLAVAEQDYEEFRHVLYRRR